MSAARAAKPLPGLVFGGEPRANLLPPEVLERSKARRARGYLVLAVVLVLAATGGGYVAASLYALRAQSALEAAQTRTTELLQEKASYAEVISATNAISLITQTREQASSTEVIWGDFVADELLAAIPGTVLFVNTIIASAPMPWEAPLATAGPLREPRVGTFQLRYATPTAPDALAIYRSFESIEWVSDISIDLIEKIDDPVGYATTITINLNADALSQRWSESDDEGADDEGK
ncbi:hypothetical protein [Schumannella luteola]